MVATNKIGTLEKLDEYLNKIYNATTHSAMQSACNLIFQYIIGHPQISLFYKQKVDKFNLYLRSDACIKDIKTINKNLKLFTNDELYFELFNLPIFTNLLKDFSMDDLSGGGLLDTYAAIIARKEQQLIRSTGKMIINSFDKTWLSSPDLGNIDYFLFDITFNNSFVWKEDDGLKNFKNILLEEEQIILLKIITLNILTDMIDAFTNATQEIKKRNKSNKKTKRQKMTGLIKDKISSNDLILTVDFVQKFLDIKNHSGKTKADKDKLARKNVQKYISDAEKDCGYKIELTGNGEYTIII